MKITLESTTRVINLEVDGVSVPARIWEGTTEGGVPCFAFITRVAPSIPVPRLSAAQSAEFDRDLQAHRRPSVGMEAIPLRFVL